MSGYKNVPFKLSTYCCIALVSLILILSGLYFKNIVIASLGLFFIIWMSFRYLRNGHQN